MLYEPDGLVTQAVTDHQPLIFVGINYRLGRKAETLSILDLFQADLADMQCLALRLARLCFGPNTQMPVFVINEQHSNVCGVV